jgi:hypothetical protein
MGYGLVVFLSSAILGLLAIGIGTLGMELGWVSIDTMGTLGQLALGCFLLSDFCAFLLPTTHRHINGIQKPPH